MAEAEKEIRLYQIFIHSAAFAGRINCSMEQFEAPVSMRCQLNGILNILSNGRRMERF